MSIEQNQHLSLTAKKLNSIKSILFDSTNHSGKNHLFKTLIKQYGSMLYGYFIISEISIPTLKWHKKRCHLSMTSNINLKELKKVKP